MSWLHNGECVTETPAQYIGFVYLITNLLTGRRYVGKKLFWSAKTKTVKGKKKRYKVESDWKSYWSSSDDLKADVLSLGEENFKREILHYCKTKGEANYLEAKEQFTRGVLEDSAHWYNEWIMVKVSRSHIKALQAITE